MKTLFFAVRSFRKAPLVSLVAIVSLAFGMGANAAMFSLFDQVVLRPLPVPEVDRLVNLSSPGPKPGWTSCGDAGDCDAIFSYPMFRDLERQQSVFEGLAAHRLFRANLAFGGQTSSESAIFVSGSYFAVLRLDPALGRLIGGSEDDPAGDPTVVVLDHGYWQDRFGARPDVLGESLVVNGEPLTIIGVAPAGFRGTTFSSHPKAYVPIVLRERLDLNTGKLDERTSYWAYLFARLAPGVELETAAAAVNVPYSAILNEVEAPLQEGMSEETMAKFRARQVVLEPGRRGQSTMRRESRVPLLLLLSVTGVVLLIACANVANLLLARSAVRGPEMAVRLSIGASRGAVVRQLLVESCLLAAAGALGGLVVARWTLIGLGSILPARAVDVIEVRLDPPVMLFAAALALGTGLLFGLFPALHATRVDLASALKGRSGQTAGARSAARFRASLVTTQIALSTALLVCAGLFTKSLVNVSRIDLGLDVGSTVLFGLSPVRNGYETPQAIDLFVRVEEALRSQPGVTAATTSLVPLLGGSSWGSSVSVEGFERGPDVDADSRFNAVGPGYFATFGIPILAGRDLTEADVVGAPKVALVNEAFARKFGLGADPVGRWMNRGGPGDELDIQIVGLVRDAKYSDVKREVPPLFYLPYRQSSSFGSGYVYVKSALPTDQVLGMIPRVVARLDPNLPVERLKTMEQQIEDNVVLDRVLSTLSASFASLATLLAAVGLYGVLAFSVSQRTRELGLRMALGADSLRVQGLVLRQVAVLAAIGGVLGLAAAAGLGRAAESLLYELDGLDPLTFTLSALAIAAVALLAGLVPAIRASRVDPMVALRYE